MLETSTNQRKPEIGTFEAARLIGVSVPTVRALAERGELDGWRIGRNYRFARQSISEFLNRSERRLLA